MKKKYFLSIALYTIAMVANAQTPIPQKAYLDINNIKAAFWSSGDLFWDKINKAEFEVPKGSGANAMFASNLWIGGFDAGKQLKIAAQTYRINEGDFWPGPLNIMGVYDHANDNITNKIWKINKCDIDAYTTWFNFGQPGPNPVNPSSMNVINSWPAFNIDGSPLAPFVDVDMDGLYNPSQGDYPKIKGDQALFFVFNDMASAHGESGGAAIGVEIQAMAYAYNCTQDSALYNTIFTNYKFINKSSSRLDSTFIGFWTDFDLGAFIDDYYASDVSRGAFYVYNSKNTDYNGGLNQYDDMPPAQAVVFLAGPWADVDGIDNPSNSTPNGKNYGDGITDNERIGLSKFMYYNNDFTVQGNPSSSINYYNYLRGKWKNGTSLTYGADGYLGSIPCDYALPGISDPLGFGTNMVPQPSWDAAGTPPGDKRAVGSTGPFTFQPGEVQELDLAYVFGRTNKPSSTAPLESVTVMQERIDSVRNKFNTGRLKECMCNNGTTGIKHLNDEGIFKIYPNPANNNITLELKSLAKNYTIKIYDATGRMVKNIQQISSPITNINIQDLDDGIYLLNVFDGENSSVKRFGKQ